MLDYTEMSTKSSRRLPGVWTLILAMLLFVMTLTGVALLEASRSQSSQENQSLDKVFIVNRVWSLFQSSSNKTDDEVAATVERIARDANANASQIVNGHSKNYYEEQSAVLVNSESAQPKSDSGETDSYYDAAAEDYFNGQQSAEADDSYSEADSSAPSESEGRSAQGRPFDSFYGKWKYATQTPSQVANNRKLQPVAANRPPYDAYDEVYDYPMGFQPRPHMDQASSKQVASVSVPVNAVSSAPVHEESPLVTFLKVLKQIWDLYQAFTSTWGKVAERHQASTEQLKKERLEKQRLRQQQQQIKSRINSKKPPRIEGNKFGQRNQTKKPKGTTSTTTRTTSKSTSASNDSSDVVTPEPAVIVEPSKPVKGNSTQESSASRLRMKREPSPDSSDVGEGRYIKGDPLKGYYDFVITEGSYKFWAAFQVGTALLIIYSTFAAIYYSKVNPLTADYDYQDYLGAGRSLSGGDDDFVDDSDAGSPQSSTTSVTSRVMNWLPRTAHSLQFILDAIDKFPLDHDRKTEIGWSTGNTEKTGSNDAESS